MIDHVVSRDTSHEFWIILEHAKKNSKPASFFTSVCSFGHKLKAKTKTKGKTPDILKEESKIDTKTLEMGKLPAFSRVPY